MCASKAAQPNQQTGQYRADGDGAKIIKKVVRNRAGQLEVHLDGQDAPVADARVARCFPWSLGDSYVSIRDKDGKELALLKTLDELDPSSRTIVQQELRDKIFNPKIRSIRSYKNEFEVISITAETDRGEVTFQIRSRDDVRVLSDKRALFRDADGNTYELTDLNQLDPTSRRRIRNYF
jgi:hypothetical protein